MHTYIHTYTYIHIYTYIHRTHALKETACQRGRWQAMKERQVAGYEREAGGRLSIWDL
jgi:hypothetical protein